MQRTLIRSFLEDFTDCIPSWQRSGSKALQAQRTLLTFQENSPGAITTQEQVRQDYLDRITYLTRSRSSCHSGGLCQIIASRSSPTETHFDPSWNNNATPINK
ncbi:hypothetical protein GOODEAATRI_018933 [Goodea atripinnis]|uniref:Uncharacterized protein n=1 Tax=Goodea atripinnis TaxID=208336 RepID=A0ABV0P625_9TELE